MTTASAFQDVTDNPTATAASTTALFNRLIYSYADFGCKLFFVIDIEKGELSVDELPEHVCKSQSIAEYCGYYRSIEAPNVITQEAWDAFEVDDLLARICDGQGSKWNGNNWVCSLTDDAQDALDELVENLANFDADGWSTADKHYLYESCYDAVANMSENDIEALAAFQETEALENQVVLPFYVKGLFQDWRNEQKQRGKS